MIRPPVSDQACRNMSERGRESDIIAKQSSDPFIIEFISASDIPLYDGKNKSDPYIQAFISTHVEKTNANKIKCFVLQREGNLVQTPHRVDCTSVVWNCYRDFNIKPSVEAVLTVQLYHRNKESTKCVMLGKIDIPVNKLANELPTTFPLYVVSVSLEPVWLLCFKCRFFKTFIPYDRELNQEGKTLILQ